jgi:hypothetical protein
MGTPLFSEDQILAILKQNEGGVYVNAVAENTV